MLEAFWPLVVSSHCLTRGMPVMHLDFTGISPCAGGDGGNPSYDRANVECCP